MLDSIKLHALSLRDETTKRDWGHSIILRADTHDDGTVFYREKFLIFNPGASIVLESHAGYDEIWVPYENLHYILMTHDEARGKRNAQRHERVFIPRGKKHKIINPNSGELCIFEIQTGIIDPNDKQQYNDEDIM